MPKEVDKMAKSRYSDLPKPIGYLKRAAINAYMMHNEELRYVIESNEYVSINSSVVKYRISRPGVDGTGGGDWSSELFISHWILDGERNEYFSDLFDRIRNTIDEILKPWKSLPDLDDFEHHMDIVRDISSRLAASSEVRNSAIIGAGDNAYRIVLINNNLSSMSGATIGAFKDNYLGRLSGVVGGVHNVAMLWGASLGSEKAIFEDARKKVVTVIEQATKSFKSVAKESASERKGGFSIALAATLAAGKGLEYLTGETGLTVFGDGILSFLKNSLGRFDDETCD